MSHRFVFKPVVVKEYLCRAFLVLHIRFRFSASLMITQGER